MYKINILENDICIDTAIVTKEKAMEIQNILQNKNKYLKRLKQQYKEFKKEKDENVRRMQELKYLWFRLFCLDTDLLSFNDIEVMEFEMDNSLF